jgi:lysyl-tRNA synthetase class 2
MSELDEQIKNRRDKRAALAEAGIEAYPHDFDHDFEPAGAVERYGEATAEELEERAVEARVPGRVKAIRGHGKLAFVDISDGREKLQLFIRKNRLGEEALTVLEQLDLGDIVGATGTLMRTRHGELSLAPTDLVLLAKALRPLPEKWHGLADVETRYRQRYLDLTVNPDSRRVFETRSKIVSYLRRFFDQRDFIEVETPMMQPMAGGAVARPFVTHHNALDMELYLRVAPELYLKRLTVGGLHRVYEINRNFRNEGLSTRHNPEFTMLEFYWAYRDADDLMDLTEEMLVGLAEEVLGTTSLEIGGETVELARPFARHSMKGAVAHFAGVDPERLEDAEGVRAELSDRGIATPPAKRSYGELLMHLFEETVEEHLLGPVFITDHPVEVSPLSKVSREDPRYTERFELYLGKMELANGFSELNDPDVQAERFEQQLAARDAGDDEAHRFDADYVRALEHAMPPAAGEGIGIDRLTMVLTGTTSIRDVILFPLLRPETSEMSEPSETGDLGEG